MKRLLFVMMAVMALTFSTSVDAQNFGDIQLSGSYVYPSGVGGYQTYPLQLGQEITVNVSGPAGWSFYVGYEIDAVKVSETQMKIKYARKGYPYGCAMQFGDGIVGLWINFAE